MHATTSVMVERVGLAAESAKAMSQVAPRLLILAGATGVGKSTAAREIAAASGFTFKKCSPTHLQTRPDQGPFSPLTP